MVPFAKVTPNGFGKHNTTITTTTPTCALFCSVASTRNTPRSSGPALTLRSRLVSHRATDDNVANMRLLLAQDILHRSRFIVLLYGRLAIFGY